VSSSGQTVLLRGVNRSGTEYACHQGFGPFDGASDDASVAALASWHVTAVRVPLNEDCWLGINGLPDSYSAATYRQAIQAYVTLLHNHGIRAILSMQVAAPAGLQSTDIWPLPDADHAPAFWSSVAATFKGDPATLFDVYNEPHDVDWNCWANGCQVTGGLHVTQAYQAAGMKQLVAAIRATGATNVVLLTGAGWGYDLSGWLANKPADAQVVASIHNYGGAPNMPSSWDASYGPTLAQVPVIWAEFGDTDCTSTYSSQVMPWADSRGVSYLAWTWDTWSSCEALISSYDGTPTTYGQGVRNHLLLF